MKNKEKQVCLVTGGARGIGFSICNYLLKKNYKIVVLDIYTEELLKKMDGEIKEGNVLVLKTDITSRKEVNESFNVICKNFGTVDILINNAGIVYTKTFIEESEEDWDKVMDVNLKGVYLCCKAAIPGMIKQNYGRIVNISSVSGFKPSIYSCSAYCASKAGVIGFSRCLASQMVKYNIRVNCVAPCTADTPMIEKSVKDDYISKVPMGRLADPIDITNAVYFLISEQSDFITGETINVNGGVFMP
jgi:NAD(P)-dependent dehydrogenase (short-subunit alcohol dehydrogenase family)